jgi:3'(2'), 5'-bisphosphate nucleotidase
MILIHCLERWLSGRKRQIANLLYGLEPYRGFESLSLRTFSSIAVHPSALDPQIRSTLRACGQQALVLAKEGFEVSQKGPEDYVTNIDKALDVELSRSFAALCPGDGLITEENAQSLSQFNSTAAHVGGRVPQRLWCIDPIDGTEDFIHGKLHYAVMAGALLGDSPEAGWIYAPAYDQMYCGGPQWGVFQVGGDGALAPIALQPPDPPRMGFCPALIGYRDHTRYGAAIAQQIPGIQFYSVGSFGLKVMEVVLGRAGLYMYFNRRVKLWDTVGPLAIAQAAGLVCCDLDGEPLRFDADAIDPTTLAHRQTILIGWPDYVQALRPKLQRAIGR